MATTFEKTWQFGVNEAFDNTSSTTNWKYMVWFIKAWLKGDIGASHYKDNTNTTVTTLQGLWTCYSSCDGGGTNFGNGDGIDYWGTKGSNTANSGSAASITTGATIVGAVRLTGLTGMATTSVGKHMAISGAASSANNSKTSTPWVIVQYNSATSVDICNPSAVTGDANNGAITWQESDVDTAGAYATIVGAAPASNHSWFVLKSPVALGPWYFIIDVKSATIGQVSVAFSKTAPSGGTATARPTATDEVQAANWSNSAPYTNGQGRVNSGLTTDGNFHIIYTKDGSALQGATIFQKLAEPRGSDTNAVFMYHQGSTTALSYTNTTSANGNSFMRDFNNLVSLKPVCVSWFTQSISNVFSLMTTTDAADGNYGDFPIYIYNDLPVTYKSVRGRLYDYYWAPASTVAGTTEPSAGTPASMAISVMWIPCCATPTL